MNSKWKYYERIGNELIVICIYRRNSDQTITYSVKQHFHSTWHFVAEIEVNCFYQSEHLMDINTNVNNTNQQNCIERELECNIQIKSFFVRSESNYTSVVTLHSMLNYEH